MSRPDEGLIHAWLDGELEPAEAERVKRLSETEPEWAAAVAEARRLVAASSRIVRALDAVPGGVVPATTARAPRARQAFRVRPWMGIAAGLVHPWSLQAAVRRSAIRRVCCGRPPCWLCLIRVPTSMISATVPSPRMVAPAKPGRPL